MSETASSSWRKSIPQSYRTEEVNNIAQVLASLEPNATPASKLMLASQFEDLCFNQGTDLNDYRKRITKRLKKLQQKYVPPPSTTTTTAITVPTTSGVTPSNSMSNGVGTIPSLSSSGVIPLVSGVDAAKLEQLREQVSNLQKTIRSLYGKQLHDIANNALDALYSPEYINDAQNEILANHINYSVQFAVEIDLLPNNYKLPSSLSLSNPEKTAPKDNIQNNNDINIPDTNNNHNTDNNNNNNNQTIKNTKPLLTKIYTKQKTLTHTIQACEESIKNLQKIQIFCQKILHNTRGHILKRTQLNLFMEERLDELEQEVTSCMFGSEVKTDLLYQGMTAALSMDGSSGSTVKVEDIQKYLEKMRSIVPLPRNKMEETKAMIAHLDKIRLVTQVYLSFLLLSQQEDATTYSTSGSSNNTTLNDVNSRMLVRNCLKKAHRVAIDALEYLSKSFSNREEGQIGGISQVQVDDATTTQKQYVCKLEDAWNKVMEYDEPKKSYITNNDSINPDDDIDLSLHNLDDEYENTNEPHKKRMKLDESDKATSTTATQKSLPVTVISSKILLRPGRNPPSSLLAPFKRKGALLCRSGTTFSLQLKFGDAFEMEIFFFPLLVTIRALPQPKMSSASTSSPLESKLQFSSEDNTFSNQQSRFCKEIIHGGLQTWKSTMYGLSSYPSISTTVTSSNIKRPPQQQQQQLTTKINEQNQLQLMGITGDVSTLGILISKKLEYASAQVTKVLRRCFADLAGRAYANSTSDLDIEYSEAAALLKFLSIARNTYIPDWVDYDLVL